MCDDPASDCCSDRSANEDNGNDDDDSCYGHRDECNDCDKNRCFGGENDGDGGLQVVSSNHHPEVKTEVGIDDYDDVSLAEVLRANSEMLNRMCRGGDRGSPLTTSAVTPETAAAEADFEEQLPDLINDIESLQAASAATVADGQNPFADEHPDDYTTRELPTTPEESEDDSTKDSASSEKPFMPFPSKIRQPKRLGIELGLYPGGSN